MDVTRRKENYTWHHLDDFNPETGECTMQLVLSDAHVATYPYKGSVSQYEKYYNVEYKQENKYAEQFFGC